MAFTTLSQVTEFLLQQIVTCVRDAFGPLLTEENIVSPMSPENVNSNILSLFLYHVAEDPHNRNLLPTGIDNPPSNFTPTAINLFYQLSVNFSSTADKTALLNMQDKFGCVVKHFHENPLYSVNGARISITPKILEESSSIQYWTAGSSSTQLSAYYMVSTVLLEPQENVLSASRVTTYGTAVFPLTGPQITQTENSIIYNDHQNVNQSVQVNPAQVTYGSNFQILGSGFVGSRFELELYHPRWDGPAVASNWLTSTTDPLVFAAVMNDTATFNNSGLNTTVLPGIYILKLNLYRQLELGAVTKEFQFSSNHVPLIVVPKITNINTAGGAGQNTFYAINGQHFQHVDLNNDETQLYIGSFKLIKGEPSTTRNRFKIISNAQIQFSLPNNINTGDFLPVRLIVAEAESTPRWIQIP